MLREKVEKLGSIFLAVFSTGLGVVLAADGMERSQWFGSVLAVAASICLAATVRLWPKPERKAVRIRARERDRD